MPDRPRDWTRSCGWAPEPWGGRDLRQWRAEEQGPAKPEEPACPHPRTQLRDSATGVRVCTACGAEVRG